MRANRTSPADAGSVEASDVADAVVRPSDTVPLPFDGWSHSAGERAPGGVMRCSANGERLRPYPRTEEERMSVGPVEYMIVAFPGNQFKGEIVPALQEL